MPDVFVARDTAELTDYLGQLHGKNIIREYTLNYYHDNRKALEKMSFERFHQSFQITDKMLQDVVKEANKARISFNEKEYNRSKELLKNHLKAFIARSIFNSAGYYPILHEKDEEFQQALKLFDMAARIAKK